MPITKNGSGEIIYTVPSNKDRLNETGVAEDDDFAICDKDNVIKQIKFDVNPTGTTTVTGTTTIKVDVPDGNTTIDLTAISGIDSFTTIQTDLGTFPVATSSTDTLTLTSSDATITITGNSTTDTVTFVVGSTVVKTTGVQTIANKTYTTPILAEVDDGNSGTSKTIDWTTGAAHKVTLTGNVTFTFTAPAAAGARVQLRLVQDGTGGRTATWPASVKWPSGTPTVTSTASAIDIVTFWYDGTNYYAVIVQNFI